MESLVLLHPSILLAGLITSALSTTEPLKADSITDGQWLHYLSILGALCPENFSHFQSLHPDTPKGGRLRVDIHGTFNSLNPYIAKGSSRKHLEFTDFELNEPLMTASEFLIGGWIENNNRRYCIKATMERKCSAYARRKVNV